MQLARQNNRTITGEILRLKQNTQMILLSIPLILLIFAFNYLPLFGWIYAFFNFKPGVPLAKSPFVGLKNFGMLFTTSQQDIIRVMGNTLAISFLIILCSPLPAIFAIMLNDLKGNKFKRVVQTVATLPNFISWVIVFSLFFSVFSSSGAINTIIFKINPSANTLNILGNAGIAWFVQLAIFIWKSVGWNAIIYLAAITSIDPELYDAASIDGAGKLSAIRHVTIPGIIETFFVLLLLTFSGILSSGLEQFLMFMNPVVQDKLEVLDYYVYRLGVTLNDVSFSTAIGIMKTFISVGLLFGVNFLSKKVRGNSLI
jgi:putative aldouronate transport system permease protein